MTEEEILALPVGHWVMIDFAGCPLVVAQKIGRKPYKTPDGVLLTGDSRDDSIVVSAGMLGWAKEPTEELLARWGEGRDGFSNDRIRESIRAQMQKGAK